MKLTSFSVQNYRSITKTRKLPLQGLTLLIGPNNEGKSNILHALVTVLEIVSALERFNLYRGRLRSALTSIGQTYDWDRDFPINMQEKHPDGESIFHLELELDSNEISEFKSAVGSKLNGLLPIQITIGKREPGFKIAKKGPGGSALSKKANEIAKFIGRRIAFQYIPTVRTAESAEKIINDLLRRELRKVESTAAFSAAFSQLISLYQPTLDQVAATVTNTLKEFLPNIKAASFNIDNQSLYSAISRSIDIQINDGTPTKLLRKGDGVQSLVALGLNRFSAQQSASGRYMILAIEEPESHLHPKAIHQLKSVLFEISNSQQIILTTHNPSFVNRSDLASNILVFGNEAKPAKTTKEIRDILGIRSSDNLKSADLVLIVEGEDDRTTIAALLGFQSAKLKKALSNGSLAIDSLMGASNLSYKLGQLRDAICITHTFLDNDKAGVEACREAQENALLSLADLHLANCPGMPESEFEDLLDISKYESLVLSSFGVNLNSPKFKHPKKKWSDRVKETFKQQAKPWSQNIEMNLKKMIAQHVSDFPEGAIHANKVGAIDALVSALEKKLTP